MQFPSYRPRRLRANATIRSMVRETALSPADLIYPIFVKPGSGLKDEISSMPGQFQLSLDMLPAEIDELNILGATMLAMRRAVEIVRSRFFMN